ncbi:hypothetical protein, partial [Galbibacter sp.]|uniref:hypothetical protein n=1 Tax=Galbibacter sp. TaxID=2918471 RepID=UPI002CA95097
KLGAVVNNQGRGSSSITLQMDGGSISDDPTPGNLRLLTHTISEKQALFESQIGVNISQSEYDDAVSCSYENRLVPFLDYDLIVFDHGYNDRIHLSDFLADPNGQIAAKDRSTFGGAFKYLYDVMLDGNPNARIVILGHYTDKEVSENVSLVWQAQDKLAEIFNLPIIKLWEQTGFNDQVDSEGNLRLEVWIPDLVHPHTDTTGKCQALLGELVSEGLKDIR